MIGIIEPADRPMFLEGRRPSTCMRHVFAVIGDRTRATIRSVSDELQLRFAAFAGVPYHAPHDLELWEQLWETEPLMSNGRHSLSGSRGMRPTHGQ
jgi:hypothetical protein